MYTYVIDMLMICLVFICIMTPLILGFISFNFRVDREFYERRLPMSFILYFLKRINK